MPPLVAMTEEKKGKKREMRLDVLLDPEQNSRNYGTIGGQCFL